MELPCTFLMCDLSGSDPEHGSGGERVIMCMGILWECNRSSVLKDFCMSQSALVYLTLTFAFIRRRKVLGQIVVSTFAVQLTYNLK